MEVSKPTSGAHFQEYFYTVRHHDPHSLTGYVKWAAQSGKATKTAVSLSTRPYLTIALVLWPPNLLLKKKINSNPQCQVSKLANGSCTKWSI